MTGSLIKAGATWQRQSSMARAMDRDGTSATAALRDRKRRLLLEEEEEEVTSDGEERCLASDTSYEDGSYASRARKRTARSKGRRGASKAREEEEEEERKPATPVHLSELLGRTKSQIEARTSRIRKRLASAGPRRDPCDMGTWSSAEFLAHCEKHGIAWQASPQLKAIRRRIANRESAKASRESYFNERLALEDALSEALMNARQYETSVRLLTESNEELRELLAQFGVHVERPSIPQLPPPLPREGAKVVKKEPLEEEEEVFVEGTPSSFGSVSDGDFEALAPSMMMSMFPSGGESYAATEEIKSEAVPDAQEDTPPYFCLD